MRSIVFRYCLFVSFLFACNGIQQHSASGRAVEAGKQIPSTAGQTLLSKTSVQRFSDASRADTFSLVLKGNSLLTGELLFTITSYNGTKIYSEVFPSTLLLDYRLEADASDKKKEEFIRKRITTFFNREQFLVPAIRESDVFDGEYSDEDIWNDVKANPDAIGFDYNLGEENERRIAYSRKLNKAVVYFNCC